MSADLGLTTWNWVSPLTDAALPDVLERIKAVGYDRAELPFETLDGFGPAYAREVLAEVGAGIDLIQRLGLERAANRLNSFGAPSAAKLVEAGAPAKPQASSSASSPAPSRPSP